MFFINHFFQFLVILGQLENAVKTSLYLREYEDVINPVDIYSLLGESICVITICVLFTSILRSVGSFVV